MSFNSLQVGYKPWMLRALEMTRAVSIPYRLATNFTVAASAVLSNFGFNSLQVGYKQITEVLKEIEKRVVSIPYRLATNRSNTCYVHSVMLFQFLIGWLQTTARNHHLYIYPRFNSLQVGYKLIHDEMTRITFDNIVSIPYRLATNQQQYGYRCK